MTAVAGRDRDPVADAAHLDQHLAGAPRSSSVPRSDPITGAPRGGGDPREPGGVGEVAQGEGGGVGGVGRPGRLVEAEQRLHHALHLLLVGAALAGDGLLDLVGRVLARPRSRRRRPRPWPAAGLADRHGGAHVDLEEHPLDGDDVGLQLGDQGPQLALQLGQPLGSGAARGRSW